MRVQIPGIRRDATSFDLTFEGRAVPAYPGETVASALIAAGIYGFRETRDGKPRGVFCGMGVCGDCQVLIDGQSRRACMEPARPSLAVAQHPPLLPAGDSPAPESPAPWVEQAPDLLVIGAGPAGLAASIAAAGAGLDVLVLDERRYAGGQYFKQPGRGFTVDEAALDGQFAAGRALIQEAEAAGVRFRFGMVAWGVFDGHRVAATGDAQNLMLSPRRIVLSPGAYERALPVPGWTLPGVMTTGAAQTLLRAYQTAPGRRVLVAGNGPLNLQVADELSGAGVGVVCVAELAAAPWRGAPAAALALSLHAPSLAFDGVKHLLKLRRRHVPVRYRHVLLSVDGTEQVTGATIAAVDAAGKVLAGSERRIAVDAVCVNYGFLPQSELARAFDCAFDYDHAGGQLRARRAEDGRSSVREVFIAGDAGGLGGARVAADQGRLAGLAVVRDLLPSADVPAARDRRIRRRVRRSLRFQKSLWRLFAAPFLTTELARADTLVCRCEEIERRSFDEALAVSQPGLSAIKKTTRAGMGRCQGRYCTTLISAMSLARGGAAQPAEEFFAPRPPAKPLPISRLCAPCGTALPEVDINAAVDSRQRPSGVDDPTARPPAGLPADRAVTRR